MNPLKGLPIALFFFIAISIEHSQWPTNIPTAVLIMAVMAPFIWVAVKYGSGANRKDGNRISLKRAGQGSSVLPPAGLKS